MNAETPGPGREARPAEVDAFLERARNQPAILRIEGEPGAGRATVSAQRFGWRRSSA
jgi:hypothetical protein